MPDQEDEAIRDLVRARTSAMTDQRQGRNRLKGFLLRLGFRYTGKSSWNDAHKRYLSGLVMPQGPQQIAFQEYIHAINDATARLERLAQAVEDALPGWKWEPVVRALMSLRGVQVLTRPRRSRSDAPHPNTATLPRFRGRGRGRFEAPTLQYSSTPLLRYSNLSRTRRRTRTRTI